MAIKVDQPKEVGADRLNAAGAFDLYRKPLIVVDGPPPPLTSSRGWRLSRWCHCAGSSGGHDALVRRTSRLRRVELVQPPRAIGRSTEEAMQSGLFYGYAGLITGLVSLRSEYSEIEVVIATGGLARPWRRSATSSMRLSWISRYMDCGAFGADMRVR